MFEWARSLCNYIYQRVYPRPPAGAVYGYRWQAGQGVPGALTVYDVNGGAIPAGLYVAFTGTVLDSTIDYFGTTAGHGPVFVPPGAVSAALTNLVTSVARNPPPGEAADWQHPVHARLLDLDGYLSYVTLCLDLVNQTAAGAQLLTALSTAATRTTFITPGLAMNQTFGGRDPAMNTLTRDLAQYRSNGPLPAAAIDAAVQATYAHIAGDPGKYNQLAADMNAAPLYTLFAAAAHFQAAYLGANFQYLGAQLAGQDLLAWITGPGGNPGFDAALRGMTARGADGVIPLEAFLQALTTALLPGTVTGPGAGAGVTFFTQNADTNDHNDAEFRPPAIGLAHELMHAWHYSRGNSPGYDIYHYSTTAAELMFAGIGPFAAAPVTENAIRAQWAGVVGADPSNIWAAPVQRLVYCPLQAGQAVGAARQQMRCI